MRKYTYKDGNHTFKRVNKTTARRAYNNGLRVILCPCNLRPGFPFHPEISISGKSGATCETTKPGAIRLFISLLERLTASQAKPRQPPPWEP